MGNKGRSDPNLSGGYTHYDSKGNKTGRTEQNLFGGYSHYDSKGNKTGRTEEGLFGGYTHYDSKGNKTGRTEQNIFGGYTHYDAKGNKIGSSDPSIFGGYSNSDGDGCYIATCIYGSYDTPEVWTLRRFRDHYLADRGWGRLFIRLYYCISPKMVARFGQKKWFHRFWGGKLDKFVAILQKLGYLSTPYADRDWRKTHR